MKSSRPARGTRDTARLPSRIRRWVGVLVCALGVFTLLLPVAAQAEPQPSVSELKAELNRLGDQIEVLSEQYNGLKIRLDQARQAAKAADANSRRQQARLQESRDKVGRLAATSYMTGGVDPMVALATARDPQAVIDQVAVLHHMAQEDGDSVQQLVEAQQAAERARDNASQRADEVSRLAEQISAKKSAIEKLVAKTQGQLFRRVIEQARQGGGRVDPDAIVGSGKAVQALRYALAQQGKPYVWGAAGPDSFDCSGLTMWAYRQVGISLPHYTGAQWSAGTRISASEARAGDLVFFYSDLHHMGMYIGDGLMVHAPHTGDVVRVASISGFPVAGFVRVVS